MILEKLWVKPVKNTRFISLQSLKPENVGTFSD